MKLVPVEKGMVASTYRIGKLQSLIEEFCNSDEDLVQIEYDPGEYRTATACYSSLWKSVKQSHRAVRVFMRNGNIYLERIKP